MKKTFELVYTIQILIIAILFTGCSKKSSSPTQTNLTGGIQGKVTSVSDGSAVSGASIQTSPATNTAVSDQSGNFSIDGIPAGTYTVSASKLGYLNNALNVSVTSGKTATANFQLAAPDTIPSPVILLSPGNDSSGVPVPPTFSWSPSNGAASYSLQISPHSSFDTLMFNLSGLTRTSYQIGGFDLSSTYYWRVSAANKFGTTEWTNTWSFSTSDIYGVTCPGLPTVTYEGKVYNTVQIGNQCWLRENLDVGTMIYVSTNQTNNSKIEKYCYNNNTANCDIYGGLYQWDEAMNYATNEKAQGICPGGWHIPTLSEMDTLNTAVYHNGNYLKDVSQGIGQGVGTNLSGFSALLAGSASSTNANFTSLGEYTTFWTSTLYNTSTAEGLYLVNYTGSIVISSLYKTAGFSVRCIKN